MNRPMLSMEASTMMMMMMMMMMIVKQVDNINCCVIEGIHATTVTSHYHNSNKLLKTNRKQRYDICKKM